MGIVRQGPPVPDLLPRAQSPSQVNGPEPRRPMDTRTLLFGVPINAPRTDIGLAILRVFAGVALAYAHGWGKVPPSSGFVDRIAGMGLPAPELFAWLAAFAEFGGGILLAVGLLTRPVAALLIGHFLIVVFLAHAGDPFRARELAVFFGFTGILYLLAGPGRYSADAAIAARSR
jgi:putative oxidoreductase